MHIALCAAVFRVAKTLTTIAPTVTAAIARARLQRAIDAAEPRRTPAK